MSTVVPMMNTRTITDRFGETISVDVDNVDGGVNIAGDALLTREQVRELVGSLTAALGELV